MDGNEKSEAEVVIGRTTPYAVEKYSPPMHKFSFFGCGSFANASKVARIRFSESPSIFPKKLSLLSIPIFVDVYFTTLHLCTLEI